MASEPIASPPVVLKRLSHSIVLTSALVMLSVAMFLALRRAIGGLTTPLPAATVCVTGAVIALALSLLRATVAPHWRRSWVALVFAGCTIALTGFFLSVPGTAAWALIVFWSVVGIEEVSWALPIGRSPQPHYPRQPSAEVAVTATDEHHDDEADEEEWTEESLLPEGVVQQVSQAIDENGQTVFYGFLRANFATAERLVILHVAFCPPLPRIPEINVHQLDGAAATIKVGELQVYGTRLEIKRSAPYDEPASVLLQFETRN